MRQGPWWAGPLATSIGSVQASPAAPARVWGERAISSGARLAGGAAGNEPYRREPDKPETPRTPHRAPMLARPSRTGHSETMTGCSGLMPRERPATMFHRPRRRVAELCPTRPDHRQDDGPQSRLDFLLLATALSTCGSPAGAFVPRLQVRVRTRLGDRIPSTYYVAWWNLENLFDEENPVRHPFREVVRGSPERRWAPNAPDHADGRHESSM